MKLAAFVFALLCLVLKGNAVQPMPGGVRITWERATNDLSFYVWRLNPPFTNWNYLGSTTNTTFLYTNSFPEGTMFGVTANQRMSNGVCCVAADVGVAGWPPSLTTPPLSVRLTPTNGFLVATGQWVKVSSNLTNYDDWMRFYVVSNVLLSNVGVRVEHRASPLKPKLFMAYPVAVPPPPIPGGVP